jgi:hypothetical protein
MKTMEWKEFRREVLEWMVSHPEAKYFLQEALGELKGDMNLVEEARLVSRLAREFWSRAGLEPPSSLY